jgi:hypothetical protein
MNAFPYVLRLTWFQRRDGLWNADCPCGSALCGSEKHMQIQHEAWHFSQADRAVVHTRVFSARERKRLAEWFELSGRTWEAQRTLTPLEATRVVFELDAPMQRLRDRMLKGLR